MKIHNVIDQLDEVVDLSRFDDFSNQPLDQQKQDIEDLMDMFDAARRGLAIVNRLKSPIDKKKHLTQVFINLNKIRAKLYRIINTV